MCGHVHNRGPEVFQFGEVADPTKQGDRHIEPAVELEGPKVTSYQDDTRCTFGGDEKHVGAEVDPNHVELLAEARQMDAGPASDVQQPRRRRC
jgi:hypothetical protein